MKTVVPLIRRQIRRRAAAGVLVVASIAAGCSSADDGAVTTATAAPAAATSLAPDTTTDASAATTSVAPSPTVATTVATTVAPTVATTTTIGVPVASGPCAFTAPGTSITYVLDGRLYELAADELEATCLAELSGPVSGPVTWSPAGDQVLLGSDLVMDANEIRETGYLAENSGVRWSYPSGKALIAPAVKDGALLWRSSANENNRIDVSFLAHTDVAAYHPAGKNILAAGMGFDGVAGVYLASNRGENARVVATLDDPSTSITEIVVDVSGVTTYFVHDHNDMRHIHQLSLEGLQLIDVATSDDQVGRLTLGTFYGSRLAYREGDCSGVVRTELANGLSGDVMSSPELENRSVTPVGWLDYERLIVAVRDTGCEGPAEVWLMNTNGQVHQVLGMVEAVSVRSVLENFGELPNDINAQAPG